MKYSAKIMVEGDANNIVKLFEPETKKFTNNRAVYSVNKNKNSVEFIITAEDSTSLRAVANSIIKNLTIYEKVKWTKKQKKK
ncbi:MAG: KEOPS complex subunit Pcc1 [archaeon]